MMTITKQDKQVLQSAKNIPGFEAYIQKLMSWVCDVRNGSLREDTRKVCSDILQQYLIDGMELDNKKPDVSSFDTMGE